MNVLLVDDEIYVVRALQKNINWTACEIDNAFIAFNAAKAREVLQKETVDIQILKCRENPASHWQNG